MLFKENNIQLTKGNLESFIKLFKGNSAVYNSLKDINNYLLNNDITNNTKQLQPINIKLEDIVQSEKLPLNIIQKDKVNEVVAGSKSAIIN